MSSKEGVEDSPDGAPHNPSPRPRPPNVNTSTPPHTAAQHDPPQTADPAGLPEPKRGRHSKSSSLNSPPPPPADFNPAPDFASDVPRHGVELLPPSGPPSSAGSGHSSASLSQTVVSLGDVPTIADEIVTSPINLTGSANIGALPPSALESFLQRPQIRAIQRLSQESVTRSYQSSRSSSSNGAGSGSDGSDVLAARRDELVSQLLIGGTSASEVSDLSPRGMSSEACRRTSTDASGRPLTPGPGAGGASLNPEARSVGLATSTHIADDIVRPEGLPGGRSRSASNRFTSEESLHAWDSVWPAANAPHVMTFPPEGPSARFPSAPLSPYVTPSFSPAVVQSTRRSSSSPPPSPGPRPFSDSAAERVVAVPAGHRSLQTQRSPMSPPFSDGSSSPRSPSSPDTVTQSSSPTVGGGRAGASVASGSTETIPSGPLASPEEAVATSQTGNRSPSFVNQFPELTPPFISRKELLSGGGRSARRLSETAVTRRPDFLLQTECYPNMSAVLAPHVRSDAASSISSGSLPTSRPSGPRRARSAQDASGLRLGSGLALSVQSQAPRVEESSPSPITLSSDFEAPISPTSQPLPPPTSSKPYTADDECAIEDDNDEEAHSPSTRATFSPSANEGLLSALGLGDAKASDGLSSALVDEGDILPVNVAAQPLESDVTFDDEGLSTLERIFLLSRSEYSFHRAYAARVLGELLGEVDPCESVEYVLPLVSGFSLDEDDAVKEAFAADLHRILWYFFSTCQLVPGQDSFAVAEGDSSQLSDQGYDASRQGLQGHSLPESITRLESAMRTPGVDVGMSHDNVESSSNDSIDNKSSVSWQLSPDKLGTSPSTGSESTRSATVSSSEQTQSSGYGTTASGTSGTGTGVDTALTSNSASVTSVDKQDNEPTLPNLDADKLLYHDDPEIVGSPLLEVDFFRPLLGTLLLSQNPAVADPVRAGVIAILSRLRGHGPLTARTWGATFDQPEVEREQIFLSQTGPHLHIIKPFNPKSRHLVEMELLHGIILGMGTLSTDVPDSLFDNTVEVVGEEGPEECDGDLARDDELFRQQMIHEATLGRALSLSFIGSVCEIYTPQEVERYGFVDEVIRGMDGDACTRAEAALALSFVVKAAPEEAIYRLLPVFEACATDTDDQVRQSACASLPALCKRIPDDDFRRQFAVDAMHSFDKGGDMVRYAALEALGEVIYSFSGDERGPPSELLAIYCDDSDCDGQDCDWDVIASYNFPGVCLTLGAARWNELRQLLHRIVNRAGERVFRTVSAFLHELAQILEPEQVAEDVLPIYRKCLEREDEVRERVFEHIDILIASLPPSMGWESFLRLRQAWNEDTLGGWRAREQLALHIPSFLETFRERDEVGLVLDMMRSALLDPFAAVRDAATFAVPRTYEIVQRSQCSATTFYDMLLEFSVSPSYRQRLTFVRCLREFMRPPPNKAAFEEFFMPSLVRLASDVVDVRLALALAIASLFIVGAFYGDKTLPFPGTIRQIITVLSNDEAVDVRDALRGIGADAWAQQPGVSAAEALESSEDAGSSELENRMNDALAAESEQAAEVATPHNRASIPSPMLPNEGADDDSDNLLSLASSSDPFEASFARAQIKAALGAQGKRKSDDVIAAANAAATRPFSTLLRNPTPPSFPTPGTAAWTAKSDSPQRDSA